MTHTRSDIHCTSPGCERATDGTSHASQELPGTKWRSALAALVGAPLRLHRYRNFHSEVVEDALRAFDCRKCS